MPDHAEAEQPPESVVPVRSASADPPGSANRPDPAVRSPIRAMFLDVGLSIVTYYGLRLFGVDAYLALLGATIVAALRLLYVLWTDRRFDRFAGFMVMIFGIGFTLSFVTGDARFLLAKDSVTTAVSGAVFGVSWLLGRPLMLTAAQRFGASSEAERREMEQSWATSPEFRHVLGVMSAVWCFGLLGEAAVRIPLIYLLPIDVMAAVSTVMWVVVFTGLFAWTQWYGARSGRG